MKRSASRSAAMAKIAEKHHTEFEIDPNALMILTLIPLVLNALGLSYWFYVPTALIYVVHLQSQKVGFDY